MPSMSKGDDISSSEGRRKDKISSSVSRPLIAKMRMKSSDKPSFLAIAVWVGASAVLSIDEFVLFQCVFSGFHPQKIELPPK